MGRYLALAAGAVTYALVRARDRRVSQRAASDSETVEATIEIDENAIDEEMEQIKTR